MISTVAILGLAGDPIPEHPGFRMINLETRGAFNEESYFSQIPVRYWDRSVSKVLLKIPNDHFIAIFGRLESEPGVGLYVLAEQIRHFQSNLSTHRKTTQK